MTPEKIVELAKQAGGTKYVNRHYTDDTAFGFMQYQLQAFAQLVRNEALEEAAKRCDIAGEPERSGLAQNDEQWGATMCAVRIRNLKS